MRCDRLDVPCRGPLWQQAIHCLTRLRAAGHSAWAVGGCVRDLILGEPVHDIDCCTSASPDQVAELFPKTVAVGRRFGVMIVVHDDGSQTEVASFRSDRAYVD
ncbi:MAG: hypothetical protein ACOCXA_02195, partial [Planctomycetota bacterium]